MQWVAGLLGISLITLKVVDCRLDSVTGALAWAHRVDVMAHGLQCLERHHRFVILGEIADQKQNFLSGRCDAPLTACRAGAAGSISISHHHMA
jgi:hypothetical protein